MIWLTLAAAVVPALLLLWFVYSKDFNPEKKKLVFKGFFYGALSVFASLALSSSLGYLWSGLMSVGLLVFCYFLFRHTRRRILAEAKNGSAGPVAEG